MFNSNINLNLYKVFYDVCKYKNFSKAAEWYGSPLPKNIEERISVELYGDIVLKIIKEEELRK